MKSLLASALVVGIAVADSAYYIGNYTANGQVNLVPYPLGVCVPTGAVSGFTYSIFTCEGDTSIKQKKFSASDTTCSGSSTMETLPKGSVPGMEGYANCDGPTSFMIINQYLSSCNLWKQGSSGIASTVVALDACTWNGQMEGVDVYSRSTCNGDSQTAVLYAQDNTCTIGAAVVGAAETTNDCHYFTSQGTLKVYSALVRCVVNDVPQRCSTPLATYEAVVTVETADDDVDYEQVYMDLFEDATVMVATVNDTIGLALGFCSQYEDAKYANAVSSLGETTLSSSAVSDSATVCWTCVDYSCNNQTLCGNDQYCEMSEQCAKGSVHGGDGDGDGGDDANSANAVYTSFTVMMGLVLSWALF